jgi:cytochrome c oxidase subunit 4
MYEPITPTKTYVLVFAVLMALTALTVGASLIDLGPFSTAIALAIAAAKATLIILFFMHARFSSGLTRLVIAAGLLWLGILIVGTMDDMLTRGWLPVPGK